MVNAPCSLSSLEMWRLREPEVGGNHLERFPSMLRESKGRLFSSFQNVFL